MKASTGMKAMFFLTVLLLFTAAVQACPEEESRFVEAVMSCVNIHADINEINNLLAAQDHPLTNTVNPLIATGEFSVVLVKVEYDGSLTITLADDQNTEIIISYSENHFDEGEAVTIMTALPPNCSSQTLFITVSRELTVRSKPRRNAR
jgi:hypothetical protein